MRYPHSCSVAALCIAAAALAACSGQSEEGFIVSARAYLDKGDSAAAVIQLKNALGENVDSSEARYLLGKALLAGGDPVAAEVELRKAKDRGAPESRVLPELARAMLSLGQPSRITSQFGAVTLADPTAQADLRTTVAAAYAQQGKTAEADAELAAALRAQAGYAPALLVEARLKAGAGDVDGALQLLDSVLAKAPDNVHAGVAKGSLLWLGKNDPAGALQAERKVLAAKPGTVPAHVQIVAILFREGRQAEARAQFDQLRKIAPNYPETLFYEAQFAYVDKNYKHARELTDALLKAIPDHVRALELAAAAEYHLGQDEQAQAFSMRALKVIPGLVLARQISAQSFLRIGEPGKALEVLTPLLEGEHPDAESLALAGRAFMETGDAGKGDAAFRRAAQSSPGNLKVRAEVAAAMMSGGQAEVSLRELESVAAEDKGPRADLALISARIAQADWRGALKAIDGLAAKMPGKPLPHQLRGQVLVSMRDADGARRSFEAALGSDGKYFPAVASLAAMDVATGKADEARRRVTEYLAANPNSAQAMMMLADIPTASGAPPDDALKRLGDAVRADPTAPRPRLALIGRHMKMGDTASALSAAQAAAAALPNDLNILGALGQVQLLAGEVQQAVSTFARLAALRPKSARYQMNLAEARVAASDLDAAGLALKKAAELDPALDEAPRGLAMLALRQGRPQEAMAIAREMQKRRPKDGSGFEVEGDLEAQRKNWAAAASAYRAASQRGAVSTAVIKLHTALLASNQAAEADRVAADWEKKHPNDPAFRFHLGDLATQKQEYGAAEAHYRAVLVSQPANALAMNNIAWLMHKQSKPGALQMAQRANSLMPHRAPLLGTLAEIQASSGQLSDAVATQKQAIASARQDPRLKLVLARYLIKAGQRDEARDQLQALQRLGDGFGAHSEVDALLKTL
ncbi:MAG: XrtA/PEP-CTERM system TPR-repeat protein PrsT [Caldimonas sp.]